MTPTNLSQFLSLYFTSALNNNQNVESASHISIEERINIDDDKIEDIIERYFHGDDITDLIKIAILANYKQIQKSHKCYRRLKESLQKLSKNSVIDLETYDKVLPLLDKGFSNCIRLNEKLAKVIDDLHKIHLQEKQSLQSLVDACQELNEKNMLILGDIKRLIALN